MPRVLPFFVCLFVWCLTIYGTFWMRWLKEGLQIDNGEQEFVAWDESQPGIGAKEAN